MTLLSSIMAGVTLFALTDLDDLLVLITFFGSPQYRAVDVVVGQFAGMGAILTVSVAASLMTLAVPQAAVGLMGLVPIALGVRGLIRMTRGAADGDGPVPSVRPVSRGRVAAVAAVTFSNGGDNIATYGPYLAVRRPGEIVIFAVVVFGMTALWCAAARRVLRHRATVAVVGRVGAKVLPFALIGLGLSILWREDTLSLIGLR